MLNLRIKYILFLAIISSNFNPCLTMIDIVGLLSGSEPESFDKDLQNRDARVFFDKYFSQQLKYSLTQNMMLIVPAILSFAGTCFLSKQVRGDGFKGLFEKLDKCLPKNEKAKSVVKSLGYPIAPAALISLALWVISKTECGRNVRFEKKEKAVMVLSIYLIFWILLNGNDDLKSPANNDYISRQQIQAYVLYPLISSILVALFTNNLINKHNFKQALENYLDNYNPEIEKPGQAYQRQITQETSGQKISGLDKITTQNNKKYAPAFLHETLDKIYKEYIENNNSVSNSMLADFVTEITKFKISIG